MDDHYATLGVSKTATSQEIRSAFRRLARQWHPDSNPDNRAEATRKFQKISEAYDVLSKGDRRQNYDRMRNLTGGSLPGGVRVRIGDMDEMQQFMRDMENGTLPSQLQQLLAGLQGMVEGLNVAEHIAERAKAQETTSRKTHTDEVPVEKKRKETSNEAKLKDDNKSTKPSVPDKSQPGTAERAEKAESALADAASSADAAGTGRPAAEGSRGTATAAGAEASQRVDGEARQTAQLRREKMAAAAEARMKSARAEAAAQGGEKNGQPRAAHDTSNESRTEKADRRTAKEDRGKPAKEENSGGARAKTRNGRSEEENKRSRPDERKDRRMAAEGTEERPTAGRSDSAAGARSSAPGGGVNGSSSAATDGRSLMDQLRRVLADWQQGRPPPKDVRRWGADIAAPLAAAAAQAGIGPQRQQRHGMSDFSVQVNHYEVLEVPRTATQTEIKAAYRRLAKQWHPDKNKNNREEASKKFQQISDSYSILSNETKRKMFDAISSSSLLLD